MGGGAFCKSLNDIVFRNKNINKTVILMETLDQSFHRFSISRKWKAVWLGEEDIGQESYFLFRKEFDAVEGGKFVLHISAERRCRLYINDTLVHQNLFSSQPYYKYYDSVDISPYIRSGGNVIGVIVKSSTKLGLLAEITCGGLCIAATDESWKFIKSGAWDSRYLSINSAVSQECFDARIFQDGWLVPGFDDSSWKNAAEYATPDYEKSYKSSSTSPWFRLIPRDIPFMEYSYRNPSAVTDTGESLCIWNRKSPFDLSTTLSQCVKPVEYSTIADGTLLCAGGGTMVKCGERLSAGIVDGIYDPCIILDFGEVMTAYFELEIDGVDGGVVDIGYVERLVDGNFNNAIEVSYADRYVMRRGIQKFLCFEWKAMRYVKLRFGNCTSDVRIVGTRAMVISYPFSEKGFFSSDDTLVNAVFDICRNTIRLCCKEYIMDTPWREQSGWIGDSSAVTIGAIYSCFGDARPAERYFRHSAANQSNTGLLMNSLQNPINDAFHRYIPDYSLWWLISLWRHYMYTGQDKWIHEFFPHAYRIIQFHEQYLNEYGLLEDVPLRIFIDHSYKVRCGENTCLNALFFGALDAFARISKVAGYAQLEERYAYLMNVLKKNFVSRLFDYERGIFSDARSGNELLPREGELSIRASEHANSAPICFGLCENETSSRIIDVLYDSRQVPFREADPFFASVVLKAMSVAGRHDIALSIIRKRWGERMVARGMTSTCEEWSMNGSMRGKRFGFFGMFRSLSHAWSASPAEFLIRELSGITIIEPGCRTVRVKPVTGILDYQAGFPAPPGVITVKCRNGKAEVTAPKEIKITD